MSTLSLRVCYRPVRIGWCVQSGNWGQLEEALRFTHAFAGGKFNPIVPVDQPGLAAYLLERFRVDVLFPVGTAEPVAAFVKAHDYLMWPCFGDAQLFHEKWENHPPYAALVDIYHVARQIYESEIRDVAEPRIRASLFSWNADDPLAIILLATVGAYATASAAIPDYGRLLEKWLRGERIPLRPDEALLADLNSRLTPSRLCIAELEHDHVPEDPGFYVGSADDFIDVMNFWNLRAAGIELVFVDPQYRARLNPMIEEHRRWLATLGPKPWREAGDIAIWGQDHLEGQDLSFLGTKTIRQNVDVTSWNGLNIKTSMAHWPEQSVLGSVDESGATPSVTFPLPNKPTYEGFLDQHIAISVSGYDRFVHDKNVTFFPPFLPELNQYYGRELFYDYANARADYGIVGGAISLLIRTSDSDITLRSLPALELVTHLFARFGVLAKPSQPGLVTNRLISQMGGIQGCRVFKIEGVRTLIADHKPDQNFDRSHACRIIGNFDEVTKRMRFEPFEDLFISPRPRSRKLQPQDALDKLLMQRVFRVGLKLLCPHCKLAFWLLLDEVKTDIACTFCGIAFDVTRQLRDRNWAYRRSGLFGRGDNQHGGIPVALTLQQLDTQLHSKEMLYTTCLELAPREAAINACETDFVVVTTGFSHERPHLPQIIIGECKSAGGQVTRDNAEHLRRVADVFPRDRLNPFILFAKTGNFSVDEIEACAIAQDRWKPRVLLLSKDELEPPDILYRHPDADRTLKAEGLEGLAQLMILWYPQLRPPGWDPVV